MKTFRIPVRTFNTPVKTAAKALNAPVKTGAKRLQKASHAEEIVFIRVWKVPENPENMVCKVETKLPTAFDTCDHALIIP